MATKTELESLREMLTRTDLERFVIGEVSAYCPTGSPQQWVGNYRFEAHPDKLVDEVYHAERPITTPLAGGEELSFHNRTSVRIYRVTQPNGDALYYQQEMYSNPDHDDRDAGGLSYRMSGRRLTVDQAVLYVRTSRDERQIVRPPLRGLVVDAEHAAEVQRLRGEAPVPPVPAPHLVLLTSWADIFEALNQPHPNRPWRNDETTRDLIRKWNDEFDGTIRFGGKGSQPVVSRDGLYALVARVQEHFDKTSAGRKQRSQNTAATAAATYRHGAAAVVVPDINGHEVNRRRTSEKVG